MVLSLSILAAILNLTGMAVYLKKQWSGSIATSALGWACSSMMVISSFVALMGSGNWKVGLAYAAGAIPCLTIFALSLRGAKRGLSGIDATQIGALMLAVGAFIVAQYQPLYSIYAISFYYLCTYSIFALSILKGGIEENYLPWGIWTLSALFNVLSGNMDGAGMALVLPMTSLLGWGSITLLLIVKARTQVVRSSSTV